MLKKFIYTPKIHLNQSINRSSKEEKKYELNMKKNPEPFTDYSETTDDVYKQLYKITIQQRKEKC